MNRPHRALPAAHCAVCETRLRRGRFICPACRSAKLRPAPANPIECEACFDQPWRRPTRGRCACGKLHEPEVLPPIEFFADQRRGEAPGLAVA